MLEEWDSQRWRPGCWEASEDHGMIVCDLPPLLLLFKGVLDVRVHACVSSTLQQYIHSDVYICICLSVKVFKDFKHKGCLSV